MKHLLVKGAAMAFLCVASAGVAQQTTVPATVADGPSAARIFEFKSYDLGGIVWYASADLPPESTVESIRQHGTATTPTVTLRSAVPGGSGMLFCFVQLPDPLPVGSAGRLTIGDIDGNDEAFFNGHPIGSTTDWGVAEVRPRLYTVPREALKPGVNVFALRLSGPGGRTTFGIRSKTLTFSLTPAPEPATAAALETGPVRVTTINEQAARDAILAADPTCSATLLQRKRPGFGRFGDFAHNGLPAVSEITPTRVATRQGPSFDVALDYVKRVDVPRGQDEPGIDGWHRMSRVDGVARGNPVTYTLRQSLLYPGAVIQMNEGRVLELRVRFPEGRGRVFSLSPEEMQQVFGGLNPPADLSVYGFLPEGNQSTPAVIAVSGMSVNITQASSQIDVSLARSNNSSDARVYLFYPLGLYRISSGGEMASLLDMARVANPTEDPAGVVRHWLRLGLHEPVGVDEFFAMRDNDSRVRVYQAMRYRPATGVDLGGPLLVRPPQVDFAREVVGYDIEGPETTSTGVLTFSGDLYYSEPLKPAEGSTEQAAGGRVHLLYYDLPVPPIAERGQVQVFGQETLTGLLNESAVQDVGTSASITAVDALYKARAAAYQAFSYLVPAKRTELLANSAQTVPMALGGHFWHHGVEPASGIGYWYTSFLQGPYYRKYDQDWGNGLSLYGLATHVKYTGEWELPERHWDVVERIFQWFTVTDDWEWMRASNSPHGYGTGAGDCQNATYAAAVAYAKLAKGVGRQPEYHYGLYTAARTALLSLNRFAYNDFGLSHNFKSEHSLVLGFREGDGFLEGELEGYPWNATSNISAYGVQSETFDLFMASAPDAVRNYEQVFEKNFPQWINGDFHYGTQTIYQGNSGMITLPHIYLRARLGSESFATLSEYLAGARTNRAFWWIAPPVIAEILSRRGDDVRVMEWERAAFLGGTIEPTENDDRRKLTLLMDNGTTGTNTVSIRLPRRPWRFEINGGPVPLTDSSFEAGTLHLKLRRPGENTIEIIYPRR